MVSKYVSPDKLALFLDKVKTLIPKKTSDIQNDSGFITLEQVPEGAVASTTTPKMDGTANIGSETSFARGDHVHPSDTNKVDKETGKGLSKNDFTDALLEKLNGIDTGANNYTLPVATAALLGGVKIGANITVGTDGTISVKSLSWTNIDGRPTNVSAFTNDANYITAAVNNLTNYYKKTETYTQAEVNNLIAAIKTISIQVVDTLPATGESNVIYLVPKQSGSATQNVKDEYIWIESTSTFEKIGDTEIDLSGYWAKADLVECTDEEIKALFN